MRSSCTSPRRGHMRARKTTTGSWPSALKTWSRERPPPGRPEEVLWRRGKLRAPSSGYWLGFTGQPRTAGHSPPPQRSASWPPVHCSARPASAAVVLDRRSNDEALAAYLVGWLHAVHRLQSSRHLVCHALALFFGLLGRV